MEANEERKADLQKECLIKSEMFSKVKTVMNPVKFSEEVFLITLFSVLLSYKLTTLLLFYIRFGLTLCKPV